MYISTGTMTYDAPSKREFTDNMRTAVDVCRLSRSTMSSWTSTTTNRPSERQFYATIVFRAD
jgi:hypothetical protein